MPHRLHIAELAMVPRRSTTIKEMMKAATVNVPSTAAQPFQEIPRFSLMSSESVVRVTPRAAVASVMVKPKGSMR